MSADTHAQPYERQSMHHSLVRTQAASVIMSRWLTVTRFLLAGLFISGLLVQSVSAQDRYPSRPIKFVVAFSAGGITDVIARLIGERLSERIGQTIVIDNKGGAG